MNKFYDYINFIGKLTFRRIWNAAKVIIAFYYSKYTKQAYQWGIPISISFEPTTVCNLQCPECPSGLRAFSRPTGMLDEQFFKKTIDQLYKDISYLMFYFQGEPYLNPHFLDMVRYASGKGIYTATSTNAHYLDDKNAKETIESGLDRLIISIDGTTQKSYESYRRGGKLEQVLSGTKNIKLWKKKLASKTPYIIFQFLVLRSNEHLIKDIKKLGEEMGVDEVRLKTAQIYDYKQGNDMIPSIDKYSRYKQLQDGAYQIKNKLSSHCWRLWHACIITWDGLVIPCCFDKDASHQLGSLKKESFTHVWQGNKYHQFRIALLKSRSKIDICQNCTEGTKVY